MHETAHAVICNVDVKRGHSYPHPEITNHLIQYFHKKYGLK